VARRDRTEGRTLTGRPVTGAQEKREGNTTGGARKLEAIMVLISALCVLCAFAVHRVIPVLLAGPQEEQGGLKRG